MDAFFTLAMLSAVSGTVFIVNWGELRLYVPLSLTWAFISGFLIGDVALGRISLLFYQEGMSRET